MSPYIYILQAKTYLMNTFEDFRAASEQVYFNASLEASALNPNNPSDKLIVLEIFSSFSSKLVELGKEYDMLFPNETHPNKMTVLVKTMMANFLILYMR